MDAEDKDEALTLRVPAELKQRVLALAAETDRSAGYIVRTILEQHFRRLEIERAMTGEKAA